jgi:hypothetical protein
LAFNQVRSESGLESASVRELPAGHGALYRSWRAATLTGMNVRAGRIRQEVQGRLREFALFDLGIDSNPHVCDQSKADS